METKIIFMILGMSIVTYLPRLLPVFVIDRINIPKRIAKILEAIPYAALGALIFPGIMTVDSNNVMVGLLGGGVAVILSYLELSMVYVISGSILIVVLTKLFM